MPKKMKVLLLAGLVMVFLVAGIATPVIAADDPTSPPTVTSQEGLLDKVAGILGVDKDTLLSAFEQAGRELRDETLPRVLDKAVEKGLITPQEADEIKEWFSKRPPAVDRFLNFRFLQRIKIHRFNQAIRKQLQKRFGNSKSTPTASSSQGVLSPSNTY